MPYLRLYSPDLPIAKKRLVAQTLIGVTRHAFQLAPEDRGEITIQFVPLGLEDKAIGAGATIRPDGADYKLEVTARNLTEEKKHAFAEEAIPLLVRSLPLKPQSRIKRLLGFKTEMLQVDVQFREFVPVEFTIEDRFIPDLERRAA